MRQKNIAQIFLPKAGTFTKEMREKYQIEVEIPKTPTAQKGKVEIHEKR
jgi:hypothetical protein